MTTAVITPLVEQGLVHIQQDEIYRIPIEEGTIPREKLSDLTEAQQKVLRQIQEEWQQENPRPVLIHGVTGSGKTQVYMKLIEQVTAEGKQVIVLIPEISLTYQTVRRFYGWFGNKVSVLNSRLSMVSGMTSFGEQSSERSRSWWDRVPLFLHLFPTWDLS